MQKHRLDAHSSDQETSTISLIATALGLLFSLAILAFIIFSPVLLPAIILTTASTLIAAGCNIVLAKGIGILALVLCQAALVTPAMLLLLCHAEVGFRTAGKIFSKLGSGIADLARLLWNMPLLKPKQTTEVKLEQQLSITEIFLPQQDSSTSVDNTTTTSAKKNLEQQQKLALLRVFSNGPECDLEDELPNGGLRFFERNNARSAHQSQKERTWLMNPLYRPNIRSML